MFGPASARVALSFSVHGDAPFRRPVSLLPVPLAERHTVSVPVIVEAVRTPVGKRNGSLSGRHPVELAAEPGKELGGRSGVAPALVEDATMGCVSQRGPQSTHTGRNAAVAAGLRTTVPGTTTDRQC